VEFHQARGHADDEDEEIRHAQIDQENIRRAPQVLVPPNNPGYQDIPDDPNDEDYDAEDCGRRPNVVREIRLIETGGIEEIAEIGPIGILVFVLILSSLVKVHQVLTPTRTLSVPLTLPLEHLHPQVEILGSIHLAQRDGEHRATVTVRDCLAVASTQLTRDADIGVHQFPQQDPLDDWTWKELAESLTLRFTWEFGHRQSWPAHKGGQS